jgi:heme/copper-type cytochrome/quinol oxidase subunit 3
LFSVQRNKGYYTQSLAGSHPGKRVTGTFPQSGEKSGIVFLPVNKNKQGMKPFHKTQKDLKKYEYEKTNGKTHFVVVMTFICMLFVPILIKLFYPIGNIPSPTIHLPNELGLSTIAALSSTWLLHYASVFKKNDNYRKFRLTLATIIVSGGLFLGLQYLAWEEFFAAADATADKTATLMGAIIVLHAFHFVIAAGLLLFSFIRVAGVRTSADLYIHFLNPDRERFFETGCRFWNSLVLLWTGIYAVMLLR